METTAQVLSRNFVNHQNLVAQAKERKASRQQAKIAHYAKFRDHLNEGAKRFSTLIANSPEPIQFDQEELRTMYTAAQQADTIAKSLGFVPDNTDILKQALSTKNGVALAQDRGVISAAETVSNASAQQAGGLPAIQGGSEAIKEVARLQAERVANAPGLRGEAAGQQTNAQVAATDFAAAGAGQAQKANAIVANTDQAAAGRAQAEQQIAKEAVLPKDPSKRQILKDADGLNRYADTGEYVFADTAERSKAAAELEQQERAQVESLKAASFTDSAKNVITNVNRALDRAGFWTTSRAGQLVAFVSPSSQAGELRSVVETIKANLALDKLAELRELSVDGSSGLGQLTALEFVALERAIANIEPTQDEVLLRENLNIIAEKYNKLLGIYAPAPVPRESETGQAETEAPQGVQRFTFNPETGQIE